MQKINKKLNISLKTADLRDAKVKNTNNKYFKYFPENVTKMCYKTRGDSYCDFLCVKQNRQHLNYSYDTYFYMISAIPIPKGSGIQNHLWEP